MHLLIPFASALSDTAMQVLRDTPLPHLSQLLARLEPSPTGPGDEWSLSPPHERALAQAWGWVGADGALPFAAQAAARDGIDVGRDAWGLVSPTHWQVSRDHVVLTDPASLQLSESESRAAFDAVRHLFESEGLRMMWGAPTRWYVAHEGLADLPCASLDRVLGRRIEPWAQLAPTTPLTARITALMRRLQSEVQMLLYPHPLNEAREARGALTLNSFWLSGCGRAQPVPATEVLVNDSLRDAVFAQNWARWAQAWATLDADTLAPLVRRAQSGEPLTLTLCGERHAQRFDNQPRSMLKRLTQAWSRSSPHTVLENL